MTFDHHRVEVLAIGAGPSNLALAVAIEELAPDDLARNCLVIEQHDGVAWQRGMLLPWTQSQVSFLKDLVTLRNPRSKFSFVNYLHSVGRLDDFVNMASFLPFRLEISDYLSWVTQSLDKVRVEFARRCTGLEAVKDARGNTTSWLARLADGTSIEAANLVIGSGRDPHIPAELLKLPPERVIHSAEYSQRIAGLNPDTAHRVVVVGAAQSAAEMLWDTYQRMPQAQCTMIMRSPGLDYYQTSKFTNELYFPSFTDTFFSAPAEVRERVLAKMRQTNYAGVTPDMLGTLYRQMYMERLTGKQRLSMVTMADLVDAKMDDGEVVLTLQNNLRGGPDELRCDLVLTGTGFDPRVPAIVRHAARAAGVEEVVVTRNYRLITPPSVRAGCYLQGTNEATHGIADSLISVISVRAGEIVEDLLAHRGVAAASPDPSPAQSGAVPPDPAAVLPDAAPATA
jgi:L-ornithine N5-oxygenase